MGLKRVAEKANVSVMTVSRVLNGKEHVAEKTRQKVLAVSKKLGVFPKARGRRQSGMGLTVPAHPTVAILIDMAISSGFLSELIVSAQRALAEHELHCVVQSYSGEHADFLRAVGRIRPPHAAACLAIGHFTNHEVRGVLAANPACVFVDYMPSPDLNMPINVVSYNNVAAARMAVHQLIRTGCKRILCLQGPPFHHFSRAMRDGFLVATGQSDFEEGQLLSGNFSSGSGYALIRTALAEGKKFDGLFTTDEMAFGALRALKEAGRRVPDDVKIMGCDGIEFGKEVTPPLSTVILDRQVLGQRAVARLMEVMKAPGSACEQLLLSPRLEIRGTC